MRPQTIHPEPKKSSRSAALVPGTSDAALRDYMAQARVRSGCVDSKDPLVCFLYTLMRDHVTPGVVEEIMLHHMPGGQTVEYCNGYLARYAEDIADRIHAMAPPSVIDRLAAQGSKLSRRNTRG